MARAGVTLAFVPPHAFNRLLATGGPFPPSLRRIVVGGGEITPERAIAAERALNCEVWNSYGSSETGSIAHHRPALTPEERGVVGHPYADIELRFVGEGGRDRKAEAGGELMLRPPMHTRALDFPSLRPLGDADGWIATGDLAHLRPDGLLVLDGRKAELLNVGGNKHAPAHFEDLARGFAGIRDLAAFRVVAPEGGDHVGLAIVPDKGFDVAAFGALLGQRLGARYPFHVMAVPELPFTEAGKIDRRLLAASFAAATARTSPDAATQEEVTGSRPG
jgi:pimaricinolide synthase loading module/candicidin polyketide synthase FscA